MHRKSLTNLTLSLLLAVVVLTMFWLTPGHAQEPDNESVDLTISWVAPTYALNGEPLTGELSLVSFRVFQDGVKIRTTPPNVTKWVISLQVGSSHKYWVAACNAFGCTQSERIRHVAGYTGNQVYFPMAPVIDVNSGI